MTTSGKVKAMSDQPIRVKWIGKHSHSPSSGWIAQIPQETTQFSHCHFIFDLYEKEYDWLIVEDDFPKILKNKPYTLNCPAEHTLFYTTEPSNITFYGAAFTSQFNWLVTSQKEDALPHRNAIRQATGNRWFYQKTYDQLNGEPLPLKKEVISTVCSSKQMKHTLHEQRYQFTQQLKQELPNLDIFGHGVRPIQYKSEALDSYKFHLTIENYRGPHHWTEKLADAFLAGCCPIYYGCTNILDYFPENSLILIDINKPSEAISNIKKAIDNPNEYEKRASAIYEARQKILDVYNLPVMLSTIIEKYHDHKKTPNHQLLYSRKRMRLHVPKEFIHFTNWKIRQCF
ncbi:MAG: glycosyltransferase [Kiritimatiellaceae bacterium]|nr:glycosyltransferase [Kiritimatiellaceae bacterium]